VSSTHCKWCSSRRRTTGSNPSTHAPPPSCIALIYCNHGPSPCRYPANPATTPTASGRPAGAGTLKLRYSVPVLLAVVTTTTTSCWSRNQTQVATIPTHWFRVSFSRNTRMRWTINVKKSRNYRKKKLKPWNKFEHLNKKSKPTPSRTLWYPTERNVRLQQSSSSG
jgi:hypothetical protein